MRQLLVALFVVITSGCNCAYSNGERVGTVTKLSRKGLFCKTWEGEMALGGTATNAEGAAIANVWRFTVKADDDASRHDLRTSMELGERVRVAYREVAFANPCDTSSTYFVERVTVLGGKTR